MLLNNTWDLFIFCYSYTTLNNVSNESYKHVIYNKLCTMLLSFSATRWNDLNFICNKCYNIWPNKRNSLDKFSCNYPVPNLVKLWVILEGEKTNRLTLRCLELFAEACPTIVHTGTFWLSSLHWSFLVIYGNCAYSTEWNIFVMPSSSIIIINYWGLCLTDHS